MTNIKISVHPVSHRLEWRGWGVLACPTSYRLQMSSLYND